MRNKISCSSGKYFNLEVNGLNHKVEIKAYPWLSKITILVDDNIVIEEILKGINRHLFYPIKIDNKDVVVALIDEGFKYSKDIYVDGISIKTGFPIDKEKIELQEIVNNGILKYLLQNTSSILKVSCIITVYLLINCFVSLYKAEFKFNLERTIFEIVFYIISSILISLLYFIMTWLDSRHKLKKRDSRYHRL